VRHAKDPLNAVAHGLLLQAQQVCWLAGSVSPRNDRRESDHSFLCFVHLVVVVVPAAACSISPTRSASATATAPCACAPPASPDPAFRGTPAWSPTAQPARGPGPAPLDRHSRAGPTFAARRRGPRRGSRRSSFRIAP
jgi:hypothetical protein